MIDGRLPEPKLLELAKQAILDEVQSEPIRLTSAVFLAVREKNKFILQSDLQLALLALAGDGLLGVDEHLNLFVPEPH